MSQSAHHKKRRYRSEILHGSVDKYVEQEEKKCHSAKPDQAAVHSLDFFLQEPQRKKSADDRQEPDHILGSECRRIKFRRLGGTKPKTPEKRDDMRAITVIKIIETVGT